MFKLSVLNLIFSIFIFIRQLVNFAFKDKPYPTPLSELETYYNLFIRDNSVLPFTAAYVLISFVLFYKIKFKRKHNLTLR